MKGLFFLVVLLFSSALSWAKIGFYCGSFDPPTAADIEVIKDALEQPELDQLIVMVDRFSASSEYYRASARERVAMFSVALENWGNRIAIVPEPWSGKENYLEVLRNKDEIHFIAKQEESNSKIPPAVDGVIQSLRLYTTLSESMLPVKMALQQESFKAFIREIALLFPNENLRDIRAPQFDPLASNLGWTDHFIGSVIREKCFQAEKADEFGKRAEKMLISSERDAFYAKLHCLQQVFVEQPVSKPQVLESVFTLPVLPPIFATQICV